MFLAKSNQLKYEGFYDGKHHFKGLLSDEHIAVSEAKLVDLPSSMVFILKQDGLVEPTYGTVRKFGVERAGSFLAKLVKCHQ